MPFSDPGRARSYFREYRRLRRGGDSRSTPVHPAVSAEFRLETAGDVLALLENQVEAVLEAEEATAIEKARCVGYLAGISLKAIECGDLAARLEAMEAALKTRTAERKE